MLSKYLPRIRRVLLLAFLTGLMACAVPISTVTTDVGLIASGLSTAYADLQTDDPNLVPVGSTSDAKIKNALAALKVASADLSAKTPTFSTATDLSDVLANFDSVADVVSDALPVAVAADPALASVQTAFQAATLLIETVVQPTLLSIAGAAAPPASANLASTTGMRGRGRARFAPPAGMTVAQAKSFLAR